MEVNQEAQGICESNPASYLPALESRVVIDLMSHFQNTFVSIFTCRDYFIMVVKAIGN